VTLTFLEEAAGASSALRFLLGSSVISTSSSESESELSESEVSLAAAGFSSSESESESELSESEESEESSFLAAFLETGLASASDSDEEESESESISSSESLEGSGVGSFLLFLDFLVASTTFFATSLLFLGSSALATRPDLTLVASTLGAVLVLLSFAIVMCWYSGGRGQ